MLPLPSSRFAPKPFFFAKGDVGCVRMLHRVVVSWVGGIVGLGWLRDGGWGW